MDVGIVVSGSEGYYILADAFSLDEWRVSTKEQVERFVEIRRELVLKRRLRNQQEVRVRRRRHHLMEYQKASENQIKQHLLQQLPSDELYERIYNMANNLALGEPDDDAFWQAMFS